jgi:hypothetical protein
MRDYGAYNAHKQIPFRQMGYKSLIDLLRSMPDVAKIDQSKMPTIIHGVPDQSTVHIKKFVMTQKRKKKPGNATRGGTARNYYGNNTFNRPNGPSMYPKYRQVNRSNDFHLQHILINSRDHRIFLIIMVYLFNPTIKQSMSLEIYGMYLLLHPIQHLMR